MSNSTPFADGLLPSGFRTLALPIVGLEAAVAAYFLVLAWSGDSARFVERLPDFAPALYVVLLVGVLIAGLVVDVLADFLAAWMKKRTVVRWGSRTRAPEVGWRNAQLWIWSSPSAAGEFGDLRVRIVLARDSAFVFLVGTLAATVGAVFAEVSGLAVVGGGLTFLALVASWMRAHWLYNGLVGEATGLPQPTDLG